MRRIVGLALLAGTLAWGQAAQAAPIFFVSSGTSINNDVAWQTAVGPFAEIDFEAFMNLDVVPSFPLGGTAVSVSLGSSPGGDPGRIFFSLVFESAAGGTFGRGSQPTPRP